MRSIQSVEWSISEDKTLYTLFDYSSAYHTLVGHLDSLQRVAISTPGTRLNGLNGLTSY